MLGDGKNQNTQIWIYENNNMPFKNSSLQIKYHQSVRIESKICKLEKLYNSTGCTIYIVLCAEAWLESYLFL